VAKKLDPKVAETVMLKAGLKPLEPYPGALNKWKCLHLPCGEIVSVQYNTVQQGKGGCATCGLKKSAKSRTFSEEKAISIMLEKGLRPLEKYHGTIKGWKSECLRCGKIVYPALGAVQRSISACAYCSGKRVDAEDAEDLMKKKNFLPLAPYVNALDPWKCMCTICKKESYPTYANVKKGSICIYCAKGKVDLDQVLKLMLEAKLEPLEPYSGNKVPWKSKCLKCNRVVYPRWNDLQKGHSGCIYCMPKGINLIAPSYVYLITNLELNAHKVGVGNKKKVNDRLGRFNKSGWQTHMVWNTESGEIALAIETAVFKILRHDLKLPIYLSIEDMPKTQGHSETVDADSISLLQLEKIINKVIKGLQKQI
jgi:hypothetical protein